MNSFFSIRPANEWVEMAREASGGNSLYGSLWHEGEMVCLMDRGGARRTAFALKIANVVAARERVLFVDFATCSRRFGEQAAEPYAKNLLRLEFRREAFGELGPEGLFVQLAAALRESGIKVCVVDSLTWLCDYFPKADAARWFMRKFDELRRSLGLSILIVSNHVRRIEPFFDNIFPVEKPAEGAPASAPVSAPAAPAIVPFAAAKEEGEKIADGTGRARATAAAPPSPARHTTVRRKKRRR